MTDLRERMTAKKQSGGKMTVLTAYDFPTASILDSAGVDIVLVGDSVGNVILGYQNTAPVTIQDMLHHTKAVRRGVKNSFLVADLPFASFSDRAVSLSDALSLLNEAGADAVKIEGIEHIGLIKELVSKGFNVMGHIGYTPQTDDHASMKGKDEQGIQRLLDSAKQLEDAGVFAIVLELVERNAAKKVTDSLKVPTIGIGSGPFCDGQVLVTHDLVGLTQGKVPKFVKQYASLGNEYEKAVKEYIAEVKSGAFPA